MLEEFPNFRNMDREGLIKKTTFRQRVEGGEGAIWTSSERALPGI